MTDIQKRVYALIAEHAARPAEDINDDMSLGRDLDLDSLDLVELSIAIEDEFKFEMTDSEFDGFYEFRTVAAVIDFVRSKAVPA